jgi:multidrug efflux pump
MTTMCFIHMAPPYFASGAGAEMRRSVGTAMLWGAFGVTLFGLFLTPVFYSVVRRLTDRKAVKSVLPHGLDAVPARVTPGEVHARNGKADYAILDLTASGRPGRGVDHP